MESRRGYSVRLATRSDLAEIGRVLAAAFHDDPLIRFLIPTDPTGTRTATLLSTMAELHLADDSVFIAVDDASGEMMGVAVWGIIGHWRFPASAYVRFGPRLARVLGPGGLRRSIHLRGIEVAHVRDPHYYLGVLGTHPNHQGRGIGSATMAPFLDRADEEGVGAYLESSKQSNVPYYARHGFETRTAHRIPTGPEIYLMWREPQSG